MIPKLFTYLFLNPHPIRFDNHNLNIIIGYRHGPTTKRHYIHVDVISRLIHRTLCIYIYDAQHSNSPPLIDN